MDALYNVFPNINPNSTFLTTNILYLITHPIPISVQINELLLGYELIVGQTRFRVKHEG